MAEQLTATADGLESPPGFHPYYRDDLFYHTVGPMFVRNMAGQINFGLRIGEKHLNAAMIAHGGVLVSLIDMQIGVGCCFETGTVAFVPTINLNCDFLLPASLGQWIEARSRVLRQSRRMFFAEGYLEVGGEVILRANGIIKIPSKPDLPDEFAKMIPPEYLPQGDEQAER